MDFAIEVKNLSKKYKGFSLDNISFNLPKGTIMGVIGENGAGKSTIIRLILDLAIMDSGNITILGNDSRYKDKLSKEHIGVVLENTEFIDLFNIANVNDILKNIYKTWDTKKFSGLIKRFSLPMDKAIKDLSKGMKMKLSIAIALAHDSKLLILDEATSGLDPVIRDEILDIFLEFIQDENNSILISSHILSDLEKICDYITFLHEGKLIFCKEKDSLLDEFALLKIAKEKFKEYDEEAFVAYESNDFAITALVNKDKVPTDSKFEHTTLEDIMIYMLKGEKR